MLVPARLELTLDVNVGISRIVELTININVGVSKIIGLTVNVNAAQK
jgi:hypothetical protein